MRDWGRVAKLSSLCPTTFYVGKRHEEGAATSTDYGGPVARRRRAEDGEAEQTCRARRGREQDFAEISRRMYEEIRSSRDPRDHVEDG